MANVPVGFRFHPTDEELIRHYLYLKNKDNKGADEEAAAAVVPEYDLYGEAEPWAIWEANGGADLYDQDLFFFTKLKKVNPHGTRINRKIGTGTWSEGEPSRPILVEEKNNKKTSIGRKRKFRYENKSSGQHGCWYMEEYSLEGIRSAEYVICRLRENNRSGGGTGGNRDLLALSVAASMEASGPIPVGFRFHPTDQELICYFLYNKNKGKGSRGLSQFMAEVVEAEEEKTMALPAPEEPPLATEEDKDNSNEKKNDEAAAAAILAEEDEKKKEEEEKEKNKEGEGQAASLPLLEYWKNKEDEQKGVAVPSKEAGTEEVVAVGEEEEEVPKKENHFLHEFDLFGSTEPWEIWEMFKGAELCNQDLFFFTQLKKVNPKGSRIGRKVGSGGTWSEGDVSKPIVDDRTGNPIGRKRKLRYEKVGSPHHACWYLDEYSLLDADIGDYVICRLRKNDKLAAAAFASGEAASNRKRKSAPSAAPTAPAKESKHPPPTAEESIPPPTTAEESNHPPVIAEESNHPPATTEESDRPPATAEELYHPTPTAEESNRPPTTAEKSKHSSTTAERSNPEEEDSNSSRVKRRRYTGFTQVEEAAADVLMNMANSTLNHNTLKLFGIEIDSTPTIGGK
ncbi:uncharacterized protein LOC126798631 [Argentina anserina]|uniref:uncharacterized protein LOC126798631 n=1 Tax=Argentina anserina TaxID=57926 RepID=UPI0021769496|nr:uncharacterized protein LOC126798631 [Potentilla anserina]